MEKTIGFIGYGNMAKAMIKGLIEAGLFSKENISPFFIGQKTNL